MGSGSSAHKVNIRMTALYKAVQGSPAHLAKITLPASGEVESRVLFVQREPGEHPWLFVIRLKSGTCNWEPMSDWQDVLAEIDARGAGPNSKWIAATTTRVQLLDGTEAVLLERDMTTA